MQKTWALRPMLAAAPLAALVMPFSAPAIAPIAAAAGLGGLILLIWERRWPGLRSFAPAWLFAGLLLLQLLSSLWSLDPELSLEAMQGLSAVLIAGCISIYLAQTAPLPEREARIAAWCLFGACVLLLAICLEEYGSFGVVRQFLESVRRPRPYTWDAASLNRASVMAFLLVWPGLLAARWLGFRFAPVGLLAAAIAIAFVSTQITARPAIIFGVGVAAAVYFAGRRLAYLVGLLPLLLTFLMPLLPGRIYSAAQIDALWPDIRFSLLHRLHIWEFAADRIREKPWFGWGLDGARSLPGGDLTFIRDAKFMPIHPHNGVLHVWLELGLAGALLLAGVQYLVWRGLTASSLDKAERAVLCGLYATLLVFFWVSFGVWQNWWIGTLGLVVAWAFIAVRLRQASPLPAT